MAETQAQQNARLQAAVTNLSDKLTTEAEQIRETVEKLGQANPDVDAAITALEGVATRVEALVEDPTPLTPTPPTP